MKRVHCLGVLVVDALSRPLARYPQPGEVTQVTTDSLQFLPGGGAANSASALAQMGLPVKIFSRVGDDPNGAFILERLRACGADTGGVGVGRGETTPFTYVGIHPDGDRTFIHTPGANRTFRLADTERRELLDCDYLLYQDCWCMPGIDGPVGAELLAEARRRRVVTLLDECWGLGPNRDLWEQMVPHADYVLPSVDDMLAIYPGRRPGQIVSLLHDRGARTVVLKMGREGCLVSDGTKAVGVPSAADRIVDTTGAGDCFDAGFVAGLAGGLDDLGAARMGSLAAAACIRSVGGATGIPPIETLMQQLRKGFGNRPGNHGG
ncbi:MAG TPA: carbohydrate kinase family protein [Phycisphaerae bacterium]|nr:carbohydrate kinase family protein [Phycisphaerae bacterium]